MNVSRVGRKRNAAFGTRSTFDRRAISMFTLAVMPGFSFKSGLGTSMTVEYVTTFWTVVGLRRTCSTVPLNVLGRVGVDAEVDRLSRVASGRHPIRRCSR